MNLSLPEINWGCHGIPERCLCIRGRRMKICARCFGAAIGHWGSLIVFLVGLLPSLFVSACLIVPLVVDGTVQHVFGIESNNMRRLITGILGGFGVGACVWTGTAHLYNLILS